MGQRDRRRHQLRRFVGGVAEHHALVTGTAGVHTLRDVRRLLVDGRDDRAGVAIKTLTGIIVPDGAHRFANQGLDVEVGGAGDLAGNDDQAGAGKRLAGHAAQRIFGEARIQDRVRDLVGDLVWVAFGDAFTGEKVTVGGGQKCGAPRMR